MKILMVLENPFPPDTRVENEIIALNNAGYTVDIACLTFDKSTQIDFFGDTRIYRIPISSFIRKTSVGALRLPIYFNFWIKVLTDLISEYRYDVIHIHDLQLAKVGLKLKKRFNIKFVLDLHENWPALLDLSTHTKSLLGSLLFSLKQWKRYEKKYIRYADRIIVVVEESKERLVKLGIDSSKIHIVSNTLNLSEFNFTIKEEKGEDVIYIYAGGITYHRGLQHIIKAASIAKTDNFRIWIVGDGRYLKNLRNQASKLGVDKKIDFYGWQNRQELLKLISRANITLIPHIKSDHTDSTIPHKLFQYMYAEKLILASNCSPIERIIKETSSGIVYQYDDADEIANLMDTINNYKINIPNYTQGKQAVIKKYNWENDSKNLLKLYEDVSSS